jgi:hypothetical protein
MSKTKLAARVRAALIAATALTSMPVTAQNQQQAPGQGASLEEQFRDPPNSARPRVWWHWMNGNVTKDGIAKDFAWMKRVGIGGVQNFDASLNTPQIVDKRLVYMTPEWKDAFRFAAMEADRLGLEMAIASSPGWSLTGGPWVSPEDGLKKLVWSDTEVVGGRPFGGTLKMPPTVTGPYQSLPTGEGVGSMLSDEDKPKLPEPHYADVAVLAFRHVGGPGLAVPSEVVGRDGKPVDPAALSDADLASGVDLAKAPDGAAPLIHYTYSTPQTVRAATLFVPGVASLFTGAPFTPRLEASDDGTKWTHIADVPLGTVPATVAFAPVTASQFRVVFAPAPSSGFSFTPQVQGVDLAGLAGSTGGMAMLGTKPIKVADFRLWTEDRIDRAEAKAGYTIARDYYDLIKDLPEVRGVDPDKVLDLTDRLRPDGSLDWTPPEGRWRVLRMGYSLLGTMNHPATAEATGLEVDKFDSPAVRRYLEHYVGMYKDAAGGLLGERGVRAILTDSIEVGAANWTPRMISQFKRLRGYDPVPWLPTLSGTIVGSRAESEKFLYDYRRTLADLIATEHYGTVAKVAHEHGLTVYGEAMEDQRPSLGDDMAMRRYADIPMSALWTYRREQGPNPGHLADMKGAASVAHVYGQNLVAAESMTSLMAPWAYGPADLKRVIDLEFAHGINRPVVHTSVHVPTDDKVPGLSLFIFGQHFNRHEAWAELAKPWVDYLARNSLMLQQGRNVADVAYFYGEEAPLSGLYRLNPVADAPKRYAYDFVNADVLTGALVNEGAELVTPGGARYRALYLGGSSRMMTLPTLRRLTQLVEGGAMVIGPRPVGNPSLISDAAEFAELTGKLWPAGGLARVGKGRVIASVEIEAALAQAGVAPDFHFSGGQADSDVLFVHRKLEDGDSYFLANRKDRSETIEGRFRVTGKAPELWRAETGRSEPVSYRIENDETIVPLTLRADESVHVVFRKPARAPAMSIKKLEPVELSALDGAWTVAFQPGRGAPASATLPTLAPLDQHSEPGIKYFSGIATYTKSFTAPRGWRPGQPLWLDLGEAREVAEVLVNGQTAGYAWHAPYRVDIGAVAKPGRNRLEVRVANLWVNRMIGDRQPGAQKITWTALPTYTADAPLRRSGLIGPVRLLGQPR